MGGLLQTSLVVMVVVVVVVVAHLIWHQSWDLTSFEGCIGGK